MATPSIKRVTSSDETATSGSKKPPNFTDILDIPSQDVSRPKPLPQGTYLCVVKGNYREDKSTKKGTEFSEYTLGILQALDDVDEEALTEVLTQDNGEVLKITDKTLRVTMWHTPEARWRLKKFLNDLGIPEEDDAGTPMSLRERMQFVPNCQVYAHVKHDPSNDGESMFANVDRTAKVED
jgi:hypothetical protein